MHSPIAAQPPPQARMGLTTLLPPCAAPCLSPAAFGSNQTAKAHPGGLVRVSMETLVVRNAVHGENKGAGNVDIGAVGQQLPHPAHPGQPRHAASNPRSRPTHTQQPWEAR